MNNNLFLNTPLTINLSLSYRCNFNCHHCYSREQVKESELTFEEHKRIVDILSDWRVPFLNLGGGEPLIVPFLFDYVRYASSKGLLVTMNSNGFLMDEEKAKEVRLSGFKSVGISIDSPVEEVHDRFRNRKGSFQRALNALQLLAKEGIKTTVSMVVTKLNQHNFADIIPLLKEYNVKQLFLHNYKCTGFGYKNMEEFDLTPEEWKDFYKRSIELKNRENDIIISFDDPIIHLIPEYNDRPLVKGSTCGKLSLNIHANGDISPCGFMPVTIGNILKDDIVDLWKNSALLNSLRNPVPQGKCKSCSIYDNCLGGCKARTYMLTGDFHNPDPHCWKGGE
ncbi:MAG: GeoRSP system radical SAM/SPASM protein [bacterium]